jgi:DNA-binding LytR/AlgR family response regulator
VLDKKAVSTVKNEREESVNREIIRAIVVEDEEHARNRLKRLLAKWDDEIAVTGEAVDGNMAVELISTQKPDLVFLDIELPAVDGLKVLEMVPCHPSVIFTTAFNKYALDAFKSIAVDYLLKPIEQESLDKAIRKLKIIGYRQDSITDKIEYLVNSARGKAYTRIPCRVGDRIFLVEPDTILYFKAENKYTTIQTVDREFVIETPLHEIEHKVDRNSFVRIHRNTIVNQDWIQELQKWFDGRLKVRLRDEKGTELIASRSYASKLKTW